MSGRLIEVEEWLCKKLDQMADASDLSVETLVNTAVEAFCDGAYEELRKS